MYEEVKGRCSVRSVIDMIREEGRIYCSARNETYGLDLGEKRKKI